MPTTIEDRLVVGDATVLADIFGEHGPFVHTINQQLAGAAADRLTQQVFVESWRERLDFDPSRGTVRNWLVRRTRDLVADVSPESDDAVDRLVIGDSLARMDDVRRQVVLAGVEASDIDELAEQLDLPVATVNGHLRRGMETLKADISDSRADGSYEALASIMSEAPDEVVLVPPPPDVWRRVVEALDLDPDEPAMPEPVPAAEVAGDRGDSASEAGPEATGVPSPERSAAAIGANGDQAGRGSREDAQQGGNAAERASVEQRTGSVDALRGQAERANLNRAAWLRPVLAIVVLVVLIAVVIVLWNMVQAA